MVVFPVLWSVVPRIRYPWPHPYFLADQNPELREVRYYYCPLVPYKAYHDRMSPVPLFSLKVPSGADVVPLVVPGTTMLAPGNSLRY